MKDSKEKGNSFERLISKKLSLWLSKNTRDDLFWRSHNSGGRYTIRQKNNKNTAYQAGDITSTDPLSKLFMDTFVIECKCYANINLWTIFNDKKTGLINETWDKLLEICKKVEKIPMLIMKQNNKPILLISNAEFNNKMMIYFGEHAIVEIVRKDLNVGSFGDENKLYFYLFDDILKLNVDVFNTLLLGDF